MKSNVEATKVTTVTYVKKRNSKNNSQCHHQQPPQGRVKLSQSNIRRRHFRVAYRSLTTNASHPSTVRIRKPAWEGVRMQFTP